MTGCCTGINRNWFLLCTAECASRVRWQSISLTVVDSSFDSLPNGYCYTTLDGSGRVHQGLERVEREIPCKKKKGCRRGIRRIPLADVLCCPPNGL